MSLPKGSLVILLVDLNAVRKGAVGKVSDICPYGRFIEVNFGPSRGKKIVDMNKVHVVEEEMHEASS